MNKEIIFGFLIGLIVPLIAYFALYYIKYDDMTMNAYMTASMSKTFMPTIIQFCIFANLPLFLLFNFIKRFNYCIGIFSATILYGLLMLGVRFLG